MSNKKMASEYVSDFLDAIRSFQNSYRIAYDEVGRAEREEIDLLHQIELGSYDSRRSTATRLSQCLKRRREYKDEVELFCYIDELMQDKEFARSMGKLKEALGKMRKQEAHMANKYYIPREIKDLEISKGRRSNG